MQARGRLVLASAMMAIVQIVGWGIAFPKPLALHLRGRLAEDLVTLLGPMVVAAALSLALGTLVLRPAPTGARQANVAAALVGLLVGAVVLAVVGFAGSFCFAFCTRLPPELPALAGLGAAVLAGGAAAAANAVARRSPAGPTGGATSLGPKT